MNAIEELQVRSQADVYVQNITTGFDVQNAVLLWKQEAYRALTEKVSVNAIPCNLHNAVCLRLRRSL